MKSNSTTTAPVYTAINTSDDSWNMREMIIRFGVTQADILAAVREVGKNKEKVEAYLAGRK
ncbi:hypothetical protein HNQ91_005274 [Filimonas zeae]|uniref:DUF3606 domain-containing protein n=1 Tax=Filimonas zeae TaxID=1737353 RepID=A0A917MY86_9BACT|nr:DUF3606 domain-containing protein [Filimonas zeae]MDR6342197.1 hypothetical protein [Filimonas zeae]GGH78728.1 hypothetical protein GCM10011379_47020 [Filimonas zeae]